MEFLSLQLGIETKLLRWSIKKGKRQKRACFALRVTVGSAWLDPLMSHKVKCFYSILDTNGSQLKINAFRNLTHSFKWWRSPLYLRQPIKLSHLSEYFLQKWIFMQVQSTVWLKVATIPPQKSLLCKCFRQPLKSLIYNASITHTSSKLFYMT